MSAASEDDLNDIWDPELEAYIADLYAVTENHDDNCDCGDCEELERLVFGDE